MIKHKRLTIFFLISFLLLSIFNNLVFAEDNFILNYIKKDKEIVVTTKHAELHIEKEYITKEEIYNIADKIEKGIRDLKNYLGNKYLNYNFKKMGKIKYYIKSGNKISYAIRSDKRIELYHVHLKRSPYIHETAHILLDENQFETPESWLVEGLPEYLNAKFANYPKELLGNKNNPDKLSQKYVKNSKYKVVLDYFPTKFHRNGDERWAFYSFAGSFVKFIEKNYGKEKLLKLYQLKRKKTATISALEDSGDKNLKTKESVEQLLGKSLEDLKEDWINSLKSRGT